MALNEMLLGQTCKQEQTELTFQFVLIDTGSLIADGIVDAWNHSEPPVSWTPSDKQGDPDVPTFPSAKLSRLNLQSLESLNYHPRPILVLLVSDLPSPTFEHTVLEKCRKLSIPVLPVLGKGSTVSVGPLEIPDEPGCTTCLQIRWDNSALRTRLRQEMTRHFGAAKNFDLRLNLNENELQALGQVVRHQMVSLASRQDVETRGHVGMYRRTGQVEWIPLVPSHDCPRCNLRPIDEPELGRLHFESRTIQDMNSLRVRTLQPEHVIQEYFHTDIGYVSSFLNVRSEGQYMRASARIQTPSGIHLGHGSGLSEIDAKQKAILETIERSCGMCASDRRSSVFGSYTEFVDKAVNPISFGVHDNDFYDQCASHFELIHKNKGCSWIWAYSNKRQEPVLIPEQIAYYGKTRDMKRYVKESSNGCALGSSLEEATLYGICEVLERDGFLNMWYAKLPVPELHLGDTCPSRLRRDYDILANRGYQIRLFDISHDTGIPAVLAVAIGEDNHTPRVVCGASCHLIPYEAVDGALREVSVQIFHLENITEKRREEAHEIWRNPAKTRDILDHVVAAGIPEAYPRWRFLLERPVGHNSRTIEDAYGAVANTLAVESRDILVILNSVLERIHRLDLDVIVVDLTNAEAAHGGFVVAKAIIPGMTPITFGYGSRRVRGLTRVFTLPYKLGYTDHVLTESELNSDCHPFS